MEKIKDLVCLYKDLEDNEVWYVSEKKVKEFSKEELMEYRVFDDDLLKKVIIKYFKKEQYELVYLKSELEEKFKVPIWYLDVNEILIDMIDVTKFVVLVYNDMFVYVRFLQ